MRHIGLHAGAIAGMFLVGLFVDLGGAPAIAQDGLRIEKLGKDAEGFDTLTFRTSKPDPVVLLGGLVPEQVKEPLATISPTAGEGTFRVAPLGGSARFFQLWQPAASDGASEGLSRVALGAAFTMAVRGDGALWSWGTHSFGALGLGESVLVTNRPTLVTGLGAVRELALGREHAVVVLEDGSLWGWGSNGTGEVGDGTRITRFQPVPVASDAGWRW